MNEYKTHQTKIETEVDKIFNPTDKDVLDATREVLNQYRKNHETMRRYISALVIKNDPEGAKNGRASFQFDFPYYFDGHYYEYIIVETHGSDAYQSICPDFYLADQNLNYVNGNDIHVPLLIETIIEKLECRLCK